MAHYGLPEWVISDQGQNFESDLISEMGKVAKVWKSCTSPYHPQTNGQCEQFSHTIINMLGVMPSNKKSNWRDLVLTPLHAYNCIRSTTTEFSPYFLMKYGQKLQLPVDLYYRTQRGDMNPTTGTEFVQQLHERLKWTYKTAQHVIEQENQRHK